MAPNQLIQESRLLRAVNTMIVKPTYVIMGDVAYSNFVNNAQVITDANSSDKAKNFTINETVDIEADFFRAGRVFFEGITLDVFVERGRDYDLAGSATPSLSGDYVIYANKATCSLAFAGIPVATSGGVKNIAAEVDIDELITSNPPAHLLVLRTAPLSIIRNGNAIFTQIIESV